MTMPTWLRYIRHHYIDSVDPERTVIRLSLRTTLACMLSILLFQFFGNLLLSTWAGFITFALVQTDTKELFFERLYFLLGTIFIFAGLTFLGMSIGHHNKTLFILSIPVIMFCLAYPACLGFSYFNAGVWGMFLYVLAGSNPLHPVLPIIWVFLGCGFLSLVICFFVLPFRPYQKIIASYERLLIKLAFILHTFQYKPRAYIFKFNIQLDNILILQEKNLTNFLKTSRVAITKRTAAVELAKSLYQLCLMTKSTIAFRQYAPVIVDYPNYHQNLSQLIVDAIHALVRQLNDKIPPNFDYVQQQLDSYREILTRLRREELNKLHPDFNMLLNYSSYFYHFIKLVKLLQVSSQNIAAL
jgi:hypothetical protein